MIKKSSLLALVVGLIGCTSSPSSEEKAEVSSQLEYAEKFSLGDEGSLTVLEPWPGAVEPKKYQFDSAPERIVVTSTTHLAFLEMLGVADRLVGFAGTQYITSEYFNQRVSEGQIKEVGVDGQLNLELLLDVNPDVVIAFDMGGESANLDKIQEAGIQVINNSDFLETTALGRAEWLKFFGAIFNKREQADSIFSEVAYTYNSMKSLTANIEQRPSVFTGVVYGDVWYMPGGKNWSAQFYRDAGAAYIWEEDNTSGWLELSFEAVYDQAESADFWVGTATFNSRDELKAQDMRYGDFQAFNDKIYSYNKRVGPGGGFDYLESGYSRPDIVLADLISIFHPHLLPDYESYYYQPLP